MLQNADQRGDKDDRAEHVQEEEGETFVIHVAEHEIGAFARILEQMIEQTGEALHEPETRLGVEEEPRQQHFNDQKLDNVANTNTFTVVADE